MAINTIGVRTDTGEEWMWGHTEHPKARRKHVTRRSRLLALVFAALLALATIPAIAAVPPGQQGYEGQPGNQGGSQQSGQQGYEGQPGNQGGPQHNP